MVSVKPLVLVLYRNCGQNLLCLRIMLSASIITFGPGLRSPLSTSSLLSGLFSTLIATAGCGTGFNTMLHTISRMGLATILLVTAILFTLAVGKFSARVCRLTVPILLPLLSRTVRRFHICSCLSPTRLNIVLLVDRSFVSRLTKGTAQKRFSNTTNETADKVA